ncbi:MAG: hypothetical protein IT495_05000 [Gammaproteobacteria bacterium]|nr:hypothetical protein [Gammaproteobacteria bacterium]
MKRFFKQVGQGMTEYIIIVALIAIAAIAAYSFFGQTLRSQVGGMAQELSGQSGAAARTQATTAATATQTEGAAQISLDNYTGQSER